MLYKSCTKVFFFESLISREVDAKEYYSQNNSSKEKERMKFIEILEGTAGTEELRNLILKAKQENKFIIHFGI